MFGVCSSNTKELLLSRRGPAVTNAVASVYVAPGGWHVAVVFCSFVLRSNQGDGSQPFKNVIKVHDTKKGTFVPLVFVICSCRANRRVSVLQ